LLPLTQPGQTFTKMSPAASTATPNTFEFAGKLIVRDGSEGPSAEVGNIATAAPAPVNPFRIYPAM
jgi:hypothetical protein